MLIHWIWLAHRPGVNDRMKAALLQHFCDPEDIFFADSQAFDHIEGLSAEAKEALQDKNLTDYDRKRLKKRLKELNEQYEKMKADFEKEEGLPNE